MMKKLKTAKACNMTYTDDDGVTQVLCNKQGPPRPAAYSRPGSYICKECFPVVVATLSAKYPAGLAHTIAVKQFTKAFRPIR